MDDFIERMPMVWHDISGMHIGHMIIKIGEILILVLLLRRIIQKFHAFHSFSEMTIWLSCQEYDCILPYK